MALFYLSVQAIPASVPSNIQNVNMQTCRDAQVPLHLSFVVWGQVEEKNALQIWHQNVARSTIEHSLTINGVLI